jgi:pyruvate/2-oxoglutarate dehydrogenase complex dihydrolipoamide dehydrogenase (E3) component
MAQEFKPVLCVIGADPGGLFLAASAAAMGVPVVITEKGSMGREWFKAAGTVPAQALIAAAERAHAIRNSTSFGVKTSRFAVDFAAVNSHVQDVLNAVAPNSTRARVGGLGIGVIPGQARFIDAATVAIDGFDIRAEKFVIATGSVPFVPDIAGLLDTPHFTTETLCDLDECPRHLIVVGAGAVGLELAQAFRRLGAEVTVLEAGATPLAGDDRECAAIVLEALEREGVTLRTEVEIKRVRRALSKIQVDIAAAGGAQTIEGSHLLIAAGRRSHLHDLGLDAAGVKAAEDRIIVDQRLRTTNKRVYAMGDVAGGPKYAHAAIYHAGVVLRNALFHMPAKVDPQIIPRVVHTDPEFAHVGSNEEEARAKHRVIRVLRWSYRESDRAQSERATSGNVKVITTRGGKILGATIVGPQAGENITTWTLAISQRLKIGALAGLVVPYASYAEMGKYAALTYYTPRLTSAHTRRIIGWLRRFG